MLDINELLKRTVDAKASDLHITVGIPPYVRINGVLQQIDDSRLMPEDTLRLTKEVMTEKQFNEFYSKGDYDLSFSIKSVGRFRINVFKQRGSCAMAIRAVASKVPTISELGLPPVLMDLANKPKGLILVTGATGMGKSTTLASMIDYINTNRKAHILTLEDPIEYLHSHKKSIVNQRELINDFESFSDGLRAGLRQDPDVILLGEMRDVETMSIALTAAETGHLVFSTLHTMNATTTIDRIIDVFPPHQQQQTIIQLANVLEAVISQQLLPTIEGRRVAAIEIMIMNPAIKNMIRERKTHQIQNTLQTGSKFGMQTMDSSIINLYNQGIISEEVYRRFSNDNSYINVKN